MLLSPSIYPGGESPTYACRGSGFKETLPPQVRQELRQWVQKTYAGHVIFVAVPEEGGESPDVSLVTAVPVRRSFLSSWNQVMDIWANCIDEYVIFMSSSADRYRQPESLLLNEEDLFALTELPASLPAASECGDEERKKFYPPYPMPTRPPPLPDSDGEEAGEPDGGESPEPVGVDEPTVGGESPDGDKSGSIGRDGAMQVDTIDRAQTEWFAREIAR